MKKAYSKPSLTCANITSEAIMNLSTQNGAEITSSNKDQFEMFSRDEMDWDEEQGW